MITIRIEMPHIFELSDMDEVVLSAMLNKDYVQVVPAVKYLRMRFDCSIVAAKRIVDEYRRTKSCSY